MSDESYYWVTREQDEERTRKLAELRETLGVLAALKTGHDGRCPGMWGYDSRIEKRAGELMDQLFPETAAIPEPAPSPEVDAPKPCSDPACSLPDGHAGEHNTDNIPF